MSRLMMCWPVLGYTGGLLPSSKNTVSGLLLFTFCGQHMPVVKQQHVVMYCASHWQELIVQEFLLIFIHTVDACSENICTQLLHCAHMCSNAANTNSEMAVVTNSCGHRQ